MYISDIFAINVSINVFINVVFYKLMQLYDPKYVSINVSIINI